MNEARAEEPPLWSGGFDESPLIQPPGYEAALRTRRRAVQVEAHEQLAALLDSIRIEQT